MEIFCSGNLVLLYTYVGLDILHCRSEAYCSLYPEIWLISRLRDVALVLKMTAQVLEE